MQAARGASLNPSEPQPRSGSDRRPRRPASRRRTLSLFTLVALGGYAVDTVTKVMAADRLTGRQPVHVVGDLLTLQLVRNPGAAFSTGTSYTLVLTFVAAAAALLVLWNARRLGSVGWSIGLGFLMAGILGNLTDRIFREPAPLRGHVVDFLALPHWPVFNVADMCINVAAGFIIVQALRGIALDGRRPGSEAPVGPSSPDAHDRVDDPGPT